LSALLELADEEFYSLKCEQQALAAQRTAEVKAGDLSAKLDALSIDAYIDSKIPEIFGVDFQSWYFPNNEDEEDQSEAAEYRQELLTLLNILSIKTISDLDKALGTDWKKVREELETLAEALSAGNFIASYIYDVFHALVILHADDLPEEFAQQFSASYLTAINQVRNYLSK
jgi:hypothetical protein